MPQQMSIDPDIAVGHHTVEVDEDALVACVGWKREMLAVPSDACVQKPAGAALGGVFVKRLIDRPIVRHIDRLPFRVIESNLLSVLRIPFEETPIRVERR